jgi:glycerate dehydrogenase
VLPNTRKMKIVVLDGYTLNPGDISWEALKNLGKLFCMTGHLLTRYRKNFRRADIPELLEQSDVVSIHCPLFPETKGLINTENLKRMKPSAFLLNTSRGPIVVDDDLADALNNDIIAGAGIDVLSVEPPQADNPLFKVKNCIITPHIAWATKEARTRLMETVVSNLAAFINGNPVNVVNK